MTAQSDQSQLTAPNLQVEAADGVTYRYRRFGTPNESNLPLVCLVHFRATLDNGDPELVDTFAAEREVILVDLAGVGRSTGTTPNTIEEMAYNAFAFLDAIKLDRYDLLGFSIGGFIAQEMALFRPWQVRRLVLAGSAPGAAGISTCTPRAPSVTPPSVTPPRLRVCSPCSSRRAPPARPRALTSSSAWACAPPSGTPRPPSPSATPS